LIEKFDQLIRSSEIRSTDPLSFKTVKTVKIDYFPEMQIQT
jgi:hypothetical protein